MKKNKDCYSLKEVCMELNIPADLSYKSSRDQLRKYFVDFLGRLGIPSDCFKNDSNRWRFNRDGKELFIDFCKHRSEKYSEENKDFVYRDLRKKITHEECIEKYTWIADCVCSNLQYNIIHSESPEDYPTEEDVSIKMENFFMHASPSIDNPLKLPGITYLLSAIKEQKNFLLFSELTKDVIHSAPEDIEFIADPIRSEFSAIYSDFFKKRDAAVKKWVYYISQFKEYRDTEHQILMDTNTPEEDETIGALLQPITSVNDLSPSKEYAPEKLSFLISPKKQEKLLQNMIQAFLAQENIYLEKQKEYPQLTSLSLQEFSKKFPKRLTSEEIYREVSKKYAALEKNS